MAEVDTSSYKLPTGPSPLEKAKEWGGLKQQQQQIESGAITIDAQKLKLMNERFGIMNNELATLANSNATKEQAATQLMRISETLQLGPQATQHMMAELAEAPDVRTFAERALVRGKTIQEKTNFLYGQPGNRTDQQTDTPIVTSPKFGERATGLPIQRQIGPATETYDTENRPRLQGPTPAVTAPGTISPDRLPIAPQVERQLQPGFRSGTSQATPNDVVAQRNPYPAPSGPAAGESPLFGEGKKFYTADQENAVQKASAVKPALQALKLMKTEGFNSGPGTEPFNKIVALAKTWGMMDTAKANDPTAVYQEITKKLADYVSRSPVGHRSDAAQTLKEASSPNPKVQILPALIKLTEDAIALDRLEIARPNAFKTKNFEEYGKHRATFPQSMDERAFILDQMDDAKVDKLMAEMAQKEKSKNVKDRNEAAKFFKSLRIADEAKAYD